MCRTACANPQTKYVDGWQTVPLIYICGSLQGMAAGVDQALIDMLGEQALQALIEQGRYRRDVY